MTTKRATEYVRVRVTAAALRTYLAAARADGRTLSDWLRRAAEAYAAKAVR